MADRYATRDASRVSFVTHEEWMAVLLRCVTPCEAFAGDIPLHRAGIVCYAPRLRKASSARSAMYNSILTNPDGTVKYVDVSAYAEWQAGRKRCEFDRLASPCFLPLLDPAANTVAVVGPLSHFYSEFSQGNTSCSAVTDDDTILAYFSGLQALAFQLSAPDITETTAASILTAIQHVAKAASKLIDHDNESAKILTLLRNDDNAEDMLQRVIAGVLLRTPPSPLGRLKLAEVTMKRNYKHHAYLHAHGESMRGIFSVVCLPPLLNGLRLSVLTPSKAASLLVRRHQDVRKACTTSTSTTSIGRDASAVYMLLRDSGLSGVTIDAVGKLVTFCQAGESRKDGRGRWVKNLAVSANFEAMGFSLAATSSTAGALSGTGAAATAATSVPAMATSSSGGAIGGAGATPASASTTGASTTSGSKA